MHFVGGKFLILLRKRKPGIFGMKTAKLFKNGRSQAVCLPNLDHAKSSNAILTTNKEGGEIV